MPNADFIHLRVHSAYSLSEGALKVKELVKLCVEQGMPAVAVTDSSNLFGALEFSLAAADAGIQPITGTVLNVARPDIAGGAGRNGQKPKPDQIVLLAQDEAGYTNLMALLSHAYLETEPGEEPHVGWEALERHATGLIALSGGPGGTVGRLLAEGHADQAEATLLTLRDIYPGRLYVELMRHGDPVEDRIEPALVDLAYKHDLPLVATNDVYFAHRKMFEAHDALLCIADGTYVVESDRRRVTVEHHFKSAEEMAALFSDLPEAVLNTAVIARRCHVMPEKRAPILPAFPTVAGRTEADELRAQAHDGLGRRLEVHVFRPEMDQATREAEAKPYRERLDYELGVIEQMGFPGYFLIVADFIKWAKEQGIPVGPGRGSGAGSVVAWALTITDLNPLRFGLLFERFLNPERVSMPDFDIDFCQDRRDRVIDYVQQKYGGDRVAQIITFGKLQARAVLRDVGRVLQMPYGQVDRLCKMVPNNPANPVTLQQAIDGDPQLREMRDSDETVRHLIDTALKLEGLYRHASTHAAGVVIGDRPLSELVALYRDPRSPMPVTQFNMKYVEQAGLVKFDFLGLKTLTVLARAVDLIRQDHPDFDLETIPLDDRPSYEMLGRGETVGVFQLESSGMRDVLRQMKPNRFEDIIALVALYRPGPMDNIPTYIEVKNGKKDPDYLHPTLQPILEETFGIMIYQEQVMQVAQVLAGFSLGGADLLRRAMGKKIKSEMDAQKKIFVEGAVARGVKEAQAASIFDQVEKFAGYGFNKSHAAAYALVAYQTAYLKANHPVEFMAASMTLDLGNTDKLNVFRQELDRLSVPLLIPDVNRSDAVFGVEKQAEGKAIRYALGAVKGVGSEAMAALVRERTANGPYADAFDFARRLDSKVVNKRQLENLIRAGAFDSLNDNRAYLHGGVDVLVRYAQATAEEKNSGQDSLFGGSGVALSAPKLPARADWDQMQRLDEEFGAIGFYLSAHPLDTMNTARVGATPSNEMFRRLRARMSTKFKVAGIVLSKREMTTKTGNRMAFIQLSDTGGVFEVTFFSETMGRLRELLEEAVPLLVSIEAQAKDDDWRLTATAVEALDNAIANAGVHLKVFVNDNEAAPTLRATLDREGKGKGRISIFVPVDPVREVEIALPERYAVTARGRAALKAIPGVIDVQEI
ncbi:DNA polymerase III subunit alpha [Inquilinus sp. CAU 1745]|uniref:DNA polymerase III subunit alpha n=1 Tax=Inquilinus sp. CAU 1745 TaxID=3140369 RepID=UPI00325A5EFF